jgi:SNF2 family DNA or RNA helicase
MFNNYKVECDTDFYFIRLFAGAEFNRALQQIKEIPGREWDSVRKLWIIPIKQGVLLREKGFLVPEMKIKEEAKDVQKVNIPLTIEQGFREYQLEAIRFIQSRGGKGIIGDDCGIGKTIEAIGLMMINKPPYVVICTASVKQKWAREIEKWTGEKAHVIYGQNVYELPKAFAYIINYNLLGKEDEEEKKEETLRKQYLKERGCPYKATPVSIRGWCALLRQLSPQGVFADECHRLAHYDTIWTRAFKYLVKDVPMVVPMSGTPMRKRPINLFEILHAVDPVSFPNRYKYMWRYCDPKHNGFAWTFLGTTKENEKELQEKIKKVMIRRLKTDPEVDLNLPDKTFVTIPMELDTDFSGDYKNADTEFRKFMREKKTNSVLDRDRILADLRRLAYIAKRNSLFQWIDEFMESHDKLVVFTWHKMVMGDLEKRYSSVSVKIDGSVPAQARLDIEDKFQQDSSVRIFLAQMGAGGEGLTLTAANMAALVELPQTPLELIQAPDRIHRYGQNKKCFIYFPYAEGTIESEMVNDLENSYRNMSYLLDGKEKTMFDINKSFNDHLADKYLLKERRNENK